MRDLIHLCVVAAIVVCNGAAWAQPASSSRLEVRVENPGSLARADETVELPWSALREALPGLQPARVRVLDASGRREIVSQVLHADGSPEALLFQTSLWPGETRQFLIEPQPPESTYTSRVYAMHYPERDDLAWENDRIAFRTYGKGLWKLENLISSGIDIWTKRTPRLILDRWYAKHKPDSYHADTGEGADFYKVGPTLGAGGDAVWRDGVMYRAGNFASHRILANGPIRTVFELVYDPFDTGGVSVSEVRRIAIDAGTPFYRQETTFTAADGSEVPFVIGLVKRPEVVGSTRSTPGWSWLSTWGPLDSPGHGNLGSGILVHRAHLSGFVETDDHYLALSSAPSGRSVTTYTGAGWSASGYFPSVEAWWNALDAAADRLDHPLVVSLWRNGTVVSARL